VVDRGIGLALKRGERIFLPPSHARGKRDSCQKIKSEHAPRRRVIVGYTRSGEQRGARVAAGEIGIAQQRAAISYPAQSLGARRFPRQGGQVLNLVAARLEIELGEPLGKRAQRALALGGAVA
jgi:hypothetical protein